MPRPEKVQAVDQLTEEISQAGSIFVTDYQGLTVADMTDLRAQLRQAGIRYRVAKNTLLRLAARNADMPELLDHLQGPTAIAFASDDPVAPAKVFHDFYSRLEKPRVRMFVTERRVYTQDDLKAVAALPPREEMLAQLVASIESPLTNFVGTLDAIIRDFVGTIDALAQKRTDDGG
ncbi:MAG: 50S ribosomal protein L10 [candidate division Zixibacteria bacterium]|nr:50S ribosomal protein L10 [candidate division Zixibacteria bacterium]